MERGENGYLFCNPKSSYCLNVVSKTHQKTRSEKIEVLVWEEAIVKCGNEAALISCIDRKKCFKRGSGDKPDILWPKVSFGREAAWTQEERFQQQDQIDVDTFANVAESFESMDDFNELATFLGQTDGAIPSDAASHRSEGLSAILDGTLSGAHVKSLPADERGFPEVEAIDKARNELSEQLVQLTKTDKLVDTLLSKATASDGDNRKPNDRLERAIAELLQSQDAAQDVAHQANKLYKFKKNADGTTATSFDFKKAALGIQDQVNIMLADTKAVRAFLPKAKAKPGK